MILLGNNTDYILIPCMVIIVSVFFTSSKNSLAFYIFLENSLNTSLMLIN